ncbi:hypothetical protein M427DRAFT_130314 [Gonapodya prolifera JEL478]|uniref:BZIP domain-containing protein n=1 Tax=Gonapodya prolifera (strain JEL478) TaxID=1344416 RepID=A0A139AXW2_GONPJ|nr:hypothetical protein M427DRAFT_130314 [Gonapodya prolifera JEL478]|eukprot:KXS21544.1 hypothetical protein M427DRAFT_130314 [Gonapodya prolifera JEL478]
MKRHRGDVTVDEDEDDEEADSLQMEEEQDPDDKSRFSKKGKSDMYSVDEDSRRRLQNRRAQKAWRERKEQLLVTLRDQVKRLTDENAQLSSRNRMLTEAVSTLQTEIRVLREVKVEDRPKPVREEPSRPSSNDPFCGLSSESLGINSVDKPTKILLVGHQDIERVLSLLHGRAADVTSPTDGAHLLNGAKLHVERGSGSRQSFELAQLNEGHYNGLARDVQNGPMLSNKRPASSVTGDVYRSTPSPGYRSVPVDERSPTSLSSPASHPSPASIASGVSHISADALANVSTDLIGLGNSRKQATLAPPVSQSAVPTWTFSTSPRVNIAPPAPEVNHADKIRSGTLEHVASGSFVTHQSSSVLQSQLQPRQPGMPPTAASATAQLAGFHMPPPSAGDLRVLQSAPVSRTPTSATSPHPHFPSPQPVNTTFSPMPPKQPKGAPIPVYNHDHIDRKYDYSQFPPWSTFDPVVRDMFDYLSVQVATPEVVATINPGQTQALEYAWGLGQGVLPLPPKIDTSSPPGMGYSSTPFDVVNHNTLSVPLALDLMDRMDPRQLYIPQPMADIFLEGDFGARLETACPCPVLKAKFLYIREYLLGSANADRLNLREESVLCDLLSRKRDILDVGAIRDFNALAAVAAGNAGTSQVGPDRLSGWANAPLAREVLLPLMRQVLAELLQGEGYEVMALFGKLFPS